MKTIIEMTKTIPSSSVFLRALETAGLLERFNTSREVFTFFLPSDEAFSKLPRETLDKLLKDKTKLAEILNYHVLSGKVHAREAIQAKRAKNLQKEELVISTEKGRVKVNDAYVIQADIECPNGVIHMIDTVLLPSYLKYKKAA